MKFLGLLIAIGSWLLIYLSIFRILFPFESLVGRGVFAFGTISSVWLYAILLIGGEKHD